MKTGILKIRISLFAVTFTLFASPAFAGSATWDLNPGSGDWNTNTNWTPNTGYPNGSADTATFALSNTTNVSISANTEANSIVFNNPSSAFTISTKLGVTLTISGTGITNNSGLTQNFTNNGGIFGSGGGEMDFSNSATAGNAAITNDGGFLGGGGGVTQFFNSSTAGNATITNNGGFFAGGAGQTIFNDTSTANNSLIINNGALGAGLPGGTTVFNNSSTAGNATITNNSGTVSGAGGGRVDFFGSSTASHGMFITNGGTVNGATPGVTDFHNSSTADHGTFTTNGGSGINAAGGQTEFFNTSTANSATLTANAGTVTGAFGGFTAFWDTSSANNATLIANGGPGQGGGIYFFVSSTGDTARVEVFGNGFLDISDRALATPNVTVGSIEGSGNIFLGAHNLSVGSNNLSTTFSGVIQDGGENGGSGGSLTKIGTGSLELDNNNTYTGGTAINGGALVVNSLHALGTSDVTLNGGTLQTLSNSPRTFDVGGNYFQNGGTLRIQIGGINSGLNSDLMAVTGAANLSSTLFLHRINNFQPMNGATVTIITAGGGVSGAFNVQNDFPGLLQPNVIYDPNDVMVQFALGSFSGFSGLTPNQRSVAHELDEVANDPAAAALINFLALEPLGNLPHDYDLIAPEELASIYEIGFSQAVVQNDNLQRRMDDIRAGSNGFCANGFVAQVSGKDYTKESDGKVSLPDKSTRDVYTPAPDNRWGVFVTGTGDFVNVGNDDTNAHGYDITTGDFTVGADYRLCDHFAIGIDAGYSRSTADLVDDGRVEVDGGKVGAYATVFGKGLFGSKFYVDGAVGGGFNSYDTRRTGLQDEFVRGSTNGNEFNAMISYGSDWTFGCFNIGTWSTVQYTNVRIDQFTETGSLAPLIIQDQDENSFRTTTGLHASYDIKAGHFIFRPEVRAAYQHEYCDSAYQVDARLASGAGDVFRVRGPNIGRDAALVGAGINMQWNNRLSTYAYYDGVLGRNNYDNNAISGGFRIGF